MAQPAWHPSTFPWPISSSPPDVSPTHPPTAGPPPTARPPPAQPWPSARGTTRATWPSGSRLPPALPWSLCCGTSSPVSAAGQCCAVAAEGQGPQPGGAAGWRGPGSGVGAHARPAAADAAPPCPPRPTPYIHPTPPQFSTPCGPPLCSSWATQTRAAPPRTSSLVRGSQRPACGLGSGSGWALPPPQP